MGGGRRPRKARVKLSGEADLTVERLDEGRALTLTDIAWRPGQADVPGPAVDHRRA
ncbi:hypothetical protein [Caulobacter sp. DWR1-3-2b1]|uniref:hypothetical protein n=1 Tax=Caulobacter sp. DWR1-3-2b1 TaxID=2804670 RepID=UPI003CF0E2F1